MAHGVTPAVPLVTLLRTRTASSDTRGDTGEDEDGTLCHVGDTGDDEDGSPLAREVTPSRTGTCGTQGDIGEDKDWCHPGDTSANNLRDPGVTPPRTRTVSCWHLRWHRRGRVPAEDTGLSPRPQSATMDTSPVTPTLGGRGVMPQPPPRPQGTPPGVPIPEGDTAATSTAPGDNTGTPRG